MSDINYISGIVKILESPKQRILKNNILITQFRAQISQFRNTRIVTLTFWGNLARDVKLYYKTNDYLIIEGYLSLRNKKNSNLNISKLKRIEITIIKVYPYLLHLDRFNNKI